MTRSPTFGGLQAANGPGRSCAPVPAARPVRSPEYSKCSMQCWMDQPDMEQLLRTSIPSLKLVNRQRLPVTACARYQLAFLMLRRRRAHVYVRAGIPSCVKILRTPRAHCRRGIFTNAEQRRRRGGGNACLRFCQPFSHPIPPWRLAAAHDPRHQHHLTSWHLYTTALSLHGGAGGLISLVSITQSRIIVQQRRVLATTPL